MRQVMPRDDANAPSGEVPVLSESVSGARIRRAPRHLADLDVTARKEWLTDLGEQPFRATQLSNHYFSRDETAAENMSDLPSATREKLVDSVFPPLVTQVRNQVADGGWTRKTLWRLFDGSLVESVLMRYPSRTTLCVSSQVGCGMACPFCATGRMGLTRNMSTAEIVEQVRLSRLAVRAGDLGESAAELSRIVFMGMGEPLANYRNLLGAFHRISDPQPAGFGISARHLSVSTCGLVPAIGRLAGEGLPVTLAISLHAPDDELRDELVPINQRWGVGELLDAARGYFEVTGRRVSIEYALIKDMNDQVWRAELLAEELNSRGHGWVHVNPIPLNPVPGSIWTASSSSAQDAFIGTLRSAGITTTLRDTRGSDIDGACGQLATLEVEEGN